MVYSKMTRTKLGKHFRILQKKTKPANVKDAELKLSKTIASTVSLEKYQNYIRARSSV